MPPKKKATEKKKAVAKSDDTTAKKKAAAEKKKAGAKKETKKEEPKKEETKKEETKKEETKKEETKKEDTKKEETKKEETKKEEPKKKETKKDDTKKEDTKKRPAAKVEADRPKRARKDRMESMFEPEDFMVQEAEVFKIPKGRGAKLGSFPSVKASVEKDKRKLEDLTFAHQFLFGKKGKYTKKEMRDHILEFSGYLTPIPKGKKRTDKEIVKEEEAVETKYSKKAFAMNKAQVTELCQFFTITLQPTKEEPKMDKDTTIDRLLDFLGSPHKDWLASEKEDKKPAPAKQSAPKKKAEDKPAPKPKPQLSDLEKIKEAQGKEEVPSDDVLRAWVRSYLGTFNWEKATTKHAVLTATDKFGVDMKEKKQVIKELIAEEM